MVILGLGSNKGDRLANLRSAVATLKGVLQNVKTSYVYESSPLLPANAPPEWDIKYLNMAVSGTTELAPQEVLTQIKTIERKLGRIATGYWGPREIDIDILAYNDQVVNEANLVIPHAHLLARDFALVPLAELAPDWTYPAEGEYYGKKARELVRNIIPNLTKIP